MDTKFSRRSVALLAFGIAIGAPSAVRFVRAEDEEEEGDDDEHGHGMDGMGNDDTPMGGTAGVFMTIHNNGTEDDRFVAVETDVAEAAEIHEMKMVGDVMEMSPLPDGLEIKAGESVELKPGGYHVMLLGLKQDLTIGMTFMMTLTFEKAGEAEVEVLVKRIAVGDATPEADDDHMQPTKEAKMEATPLPAVSVGDLVIEGVVARPAPAMLDDEATPSPSM